MLQIGVDAQSCTTLFPSGTPLPCKPGVWALRTPSQGPSSYSTAATDWASVPRSSRPLSLLCSNCPADPTGSFSLSP